MLCMYKIARYKNINLKIKNDKPYTCLSCVSPYLILVLIPYVFSCFCLPLRLHVYI